MCRNFFFSAIIVFVILFVFNNRVCNAQDVQYGYNPDVARIQQVMAKARRGENIVLGFLGGSITQGFAASSENTRWVNLVTDWWKQTFPQSKITIINAGVGGTGSNIGTFRLKNDLLYARPDFVIVEFAVNDSLNILSTTMMEGIARQLLSDDKKPGIMMLCLRDEKGMTAQSFHLPVAKHYKIPLISFADRIEEQVKKDGISLHDLYSDGLHPLDLGMKYIAGFIIDELNKIYSSLPSNNKLPLINTELPKPLITDLFANTNKYSVLNLIPDSNTGWKKENSSWVATEPGSELTFKISGNAIAIQYTRFNTPDRGKAEIWVDDKEHIVLDAYWTQNWGPANLLKLLGQDFDNGEHTLHVKLLHDTSDGSKGHYFQLLNVLTAENKPAVKENLAFYGASNKNLRYTGRIDFTNLEIPKLITPGSYITVRFKGKFCGIYINDEVLWGTSYNYIEFVIDDTIRKRIRTTGKYNLIRIADNLDDGEHELLICKDTEVNIGYIEFQGIKCKELLPLKPEKSRKIEFIGNSITCGTGSDLSEIGCGKGQWHDQHNAYMAYGPVLARRFDATWQLSSYSGIGLIHSCCDIKFAMPEVFDRISLTPGSKKWDFTRYIPDLVTICLGQNDGIQDSMKFCDAYVKFIKQIRGYYPNAEIVCLTSPMGDGRLTKTLKNYIGGIVENINKQGDLKVSKFFFKRQYSSGCDSHPNLDEHQMIANELEPFIKKLMVW